MRTPFIAGNWKMNMTCAQAREFAEGLKAAELKSGVKAAVAAPFTALAVLKDALKGTDVKVYAQNMHFEDSGAFTGEISAEMLLEAGADGVIIGHSERRQYFAETDETVLLKARKAFAKGLSVIVCVGEGLEERQAEKHLETVEKQVKYLVSGLEPEQVSELTIAYEPIWAIGTGLTATPAQAQEMCAFIRKTAAAASTAEAAEKLTVQYGGSVKPSNIAALMAEGDIDGALVGGASLKADSFAALVNY